MANLNQINAAAQAGEKHFQRGRASIQSPPCSPSQPAKRLLHLPRSHGYSTSLTTASNIHRVRCCVTSCGHWQMCPPLPTPQQALTQTYTAWANHATWPLDAGTHVTAEGGSAYTRTPMSMTSTDSKYISPTGVYHHHLVSPTSAVFSFPTMGSTWGCDVSTATVSLGDRNFSAPL